MVNAYIMIWLIYCDGIEATVLIVEQLEFIYQLCFFDNKYIFPDRIHVY